MKSAILSPDGIYRYRLTRDIGTVVNQEYNCVFIMLNPSTADATQDDPTIRRCMGFTRDWGIDTLHVVNLFAYRATDPTKLYDTPDPIGPENDQYILATCKNAKLVICAWGNHGGLLGRDLQVRKLLRDAAVPLHHLGLNREGVHPKHPLYLKRTTQPQEWV